MTGSATVGFGLATTVTMNGLGTENLTGGVSGNTYSGGTTMTLGTLQAGSNSAFSPNSVYTFSAIASAILDLNGFSNSVGGLVGADTQANAGITTFSGNNSVTLRNVTPANRRPWFWPPWRGRRARAGSAVHFGRRATGRRLVPP